MLSQKQTELRQHLEWLEKEGIIKLEPSGFTFTEQGQQTCKELGYYPSHTVFDVPANRLKEIGLFKEADWEQLFMKFIQEAKVPQKLEGTRGEVYYANKYSVPGMKAFKKALQGGYVYDILVKSTMLYYKSSVKLKKAIGNYFAQEDFKSDYQALTEAAASGTLTEHIKSETNDEQQSAWKLG